MTKRIPGSREEHAWLSDEQLAKCTPADQADIFESPVPTRMVSNGEYMPHPQTEKQRRVEARIKDMAETAAKKLGVSRRKFLASSGGMAAAFIAMNQEHGHFFNVKDEEIYEPGARAQYGPPADLFVFDDQTHMIRTTQSSPQSLRALAQGPGPASTAAGFTSNPFNGAGGNPAGVDELGNAWTPWNPKQLHPDFPPNPGPPTLLDGEFHLGAYIRRMFLEAQTTVAVLSNANFAAVPVGPMETAPPKNVAESLQFEILTGLQTGGVRDFINQIAGSRRMMAHGQMYVGIGNLADPTFGDYTQWQIDNFHPDSWKGYCIAPAAKVDTDPNSPMTVWRLDDEAVAYPIYEVIAKNRQELRDRPGFFNICIHKGLSPNPPDDPEHGNPIDIPKAATDWPEFNFCIYHSCIRPSFWVLESLNEINSGAIRGGVPDITWTTQFAQLSARLPNVYAELGTTFASSVITFPTVCAHILGQLSRFMSHDRILFGSDSLWYGGPQWQIEALWRFQIPERLQRQWRYPPLTDEAKRKILGLNNARLYGLHGRAATPQGYRPVPRDFGSQVPDSLVNLLAGNGYSTAYNQDNFAKMRKQYAEFGGERSNTRFGWIRTTV
jgi:hypothetical protein